MIAVNIWILTALSVVPQKDLILRCCLIHLQKSSTRQTIFIQEGNLQSRYFQVVGQVDKSSVQISCIVDNSAKFFRILLGSVVTCQFYKLIREYAIFIMVDIKFFKDFILEIPSLPYNKKRFNLCNMKESLQIKISRSKM